MIKKFFFFNIVFLFNLSRESYNAVANWLSDARSLASPNIVIILCGNKKDLEDQRQVTFLEANRFAQENGKID
jgi:Ras-related protein Rab-4B